MTERTEPDRRPSPWRCTTCMQPVELRDAAAHYERCIDDRPDQANPEGTHDEL